MDYYSVVKNNVICSNMGGPRECHSEWSKSDRRNIAWQPLYVESKERNDTKWTCTTEIDTQTSRTKLTVAGGEERGKGRWGVWYEHVHRALFKLGDQQGPTAPLRELCSVPAWVGGEFDGEGIRVYVWLSPFAVHLVQHCLLIGYTPIKIKSLKGEKKRWLKNWKHSR